MLDRHGAVVGMNPEAEALAGVPLSKARGTPIGAVLHLRDEFSGEPPSPDTRTVVVPTTGGEMRTFELVVLPHEEARIDGGGWTVVLRPAISAGDIEAEGWAVLARTSNEGTAIADAADGPRGGTLGIVSVPFAAMHGYTPAEMLGMPVRTLYPRDFGPGPLPEESLPDVGVRTWSAEHVRKDGTRFPVVVSGQTVRDPLGMARFRAFHVENVTERREAERREEAERRLREHVLEVVPSILYLTNPAAPEAEHPQEILTRSRVAIIEGTFNTASLHPEDRPRLADYLRRLRSLADGEVASFEYRLPEDATGRWRWFLSRDVVFARDERGAVTRILGAANDITDLKRSEASLIRTAGRDAYRVRLADALRAISDPVEIQGAAARLLGERFGASRVHYAEFEDDGEHAIVRRDYAPKGPNRAGRYRMADFATLHRETGAGRTFLVEDIPNDPRLSEGEKSVFASLPVAAIAVAPLVKDGRLDAVLAVHLDRPHAWTPEEAALIEETAERTWEAVRRARAEEALRSEREEIHRGLEVARTVVARWNFPSDEVTLEGDVAGVYGLPPGTRRVSGEAIRAAIHPDDAERAGEVLRRVVAEGGEFEIEHRIRRFDGREGRLLSRGVVYEDGGDPPGRVMVGLATERGEPREPPRTEPHRCA